MDLKKRYYATMAEEVRKNFSKRGIESEFFETSKDAVISVLSGIPSGSSVSWGGSMTLFEAGFQDGLRKGDFYLHDRDRVNSPEEEIEIFHKAIGCDYYFMGTNALTLDGKLVNIDGFGNRLAALLFGPKNVIVVAGMNKLVKNEEEAVYRTRNEAAPQNAFRLSKKTPCSLKGFCSDCLSTDCICSHTVITRRSEVPNRIKVILIGEELGY